jgi:hypothetical protein
MIDRYGTQSVAWMAEVVAASGPETNEEASPRIFDFPDIEANNCLALTFLANSCK